MPIFQLTEDLVFPHPKFANDDGILAVGGDLSVNRLILSYKNGIFPWFNEDDPIIWWSPDPRCVLFTDNIKISKSMRQLLSKNEFDVTLDNNFVDVISNCGKTKRKGQKGTWITEEMRFAYLELHKQGFAHSVEVWNNSELVGGLYGVFIGKTFFGESMFAKKSNTSKYGFIKLVEALNKSDVSLIDCQTTTEHLISLGAEEINRDRFLQLLEVNTVIEETPEIWNSVVQHFES